MKTLKKYLKKKYNYDGNLPTKCHLCQSSNIFAGHTSCDKLGVGCYNCHLSLSIQYDEYYFDNPCSTEVGYENLLLTTVIKLWNKEIKIEDLVKEEIIRCKCCDEEISNVSLKKNKKCPECGGIFK